MSEQRGINDPLYEMAVKLVRQFGRPSYSYVQRHLQIGYNRAADMVDAMVGTVIDAMPPSGKVLTAAAASSPAPEQQGGGKTDGVRGNGNG